LFFSKLRSLNSTLVYGFLNSFEKQWTRHLKGWFEGYTPGKPSTKNGLESWNLVIKNECTFKQRHNLGKFLSILENDMINFWSKERNPDNVNCRNFEDDFAINLPLYTSAFQWTSSIKTENIIKLKHQEKSYYFTHEDLQFKLRKDRVQDYLSKKQNVSWKDFKEYQESCSIYQTYIDKTNWRNSKCICREFQKNHICLHIIGIAYRYKLLEIPEAAKIIPIGLKRKKRSFKEN